MKILICISLTVLMGACGKKDENNALPAPADTTTKSPYPYSVKYSGTIWSSLSNSPVLNPNAALGFDTAYQTSIIVEYPDSTNIRFHLSFWDYKDTSMLGNYVRYYFEQTSLHTKTGDIAYEDGIRHHKTYYTLRSDSLIIIKSDFEGSDYLRDVEFRGKK